VLANKKNFAGLGSKPHLLSKQNDAIRGMLERGNKPITSSKDPLVSNSDLSTVIGGTPQPKL